MPVCKGCGDSCHWCSGLTAQVPTAGTGLPAATPTPHQASSQAHCQVAMEKQMWCHEPCQMSGFSKVPLKKKILSCITAVVP